MIQNLKEWFKKTFSKTSYTGYLDLNRQLLDKKKELETLAKSHSEFKANCDFIIKGYSSNIVDKVNERYNLYYSEYLDKVKDLKCDIDILKGEMSSILKANPNFEKEEQFEFFKGTIVLIEAWEAGLINDEQYKEIQNRSRDLIIEKGWDIQGFIDLLAKKNIVDETKKTLYSDMIVKNQKGEILLLLRNKQSDFAPGQWCLPGGHVDKGENHECAAIRELKEETGIEVEEKDVRLVKQLDIDKGEIWYYCVTLDKYVEVRLLEDEHINYIWCKNYSQLDLMLNLKDVLDSTSVNEIEKGFGHKYIKKEYKNGKWEYIYKEDIEKENKGSAETKDLKQKTNELKKNVKKIKEDIDEISLKLKNAFIKSGSFNSNCTPNSPNFNAGYHIFLNRNKNEFEGEVNIIKEKNEKIYKINEEIIKNESILNPNKLSTLKELDTLIGFAETEFEKLSRNVPKKLPYREVYKDITSDNYYIGTETTFKEVPLGDLSVTEKWESIKKQGDFQKSPLSDSQYVTTDKGVYRISDHWGRCASCYWDFEGNNTSGFVIGYSDFSDFKVGYAGMYFTTNPEWTLKAPDTIKETSHNLNLIKESFKLNEKGINKINDRLEILKKLELELQNNLKEDK